MWEIPLLLGFGAGALSTVNPCGFAMLPAFIAFFLGEREAGRVAVSARLARAVRVAGLVTLGFLLTFGAIGAAISFTAGPVLRSLPWITLVAGVAIVGAGMLVLSGRTFSLGITPRSRVEGRSPRAMVAYGVAFGLASLGCTLPVFLIVVAGALDAGGFVPGLMVFLAYAVGMGTVLLGVTLATAVTKGSLVRLLKRGMRYVEPVSGLGLILAGAYLVWREVAFLRFGGFL